MGARIVGGGNTRASTSADRGVTKAGQKSKKTSTSKSTGSGDAKLAAYNASHSSESGTPPIKTMSEEERQANMLITSAVGRAEGINRSKEAIAKIKNSNAQKAFEQSGGNIPALNGDINLVPNTIGNPNIKDLQSINFKRTISSGAGSYNNIPDAALDLGYGHHVDMPVGIEVLTGQADWQQNSSSWDRTKLKIKDKLEPVTDAYNSLERSVSDMIPTLSENKERDAAIMGELMSNSPKYAAAVKEMQENHPEQLEQTTFGNIYDSTYAHAQEKPITTAAEIAAMYAGGYVIGAGGKLASVGARSGLLKAGAKIGQGASKGSTLSVVGNTISSSEKLVDPMLAIVGTAPLVSDLAEGSPISIQANRDENIGFAYDIEYDNSKVPEFAGQAFDYAVMGAGAIKGWGAGTNLIGRFQTRGRTEIPLDTITDADVASGLQDFPLTRRGQTPEEVIAEFRASEHGLPGEEGLHVWHGTGGKFNEVTPVRTDIARGLESTDMPGLYVSPRASPNFTHVQRTISPSGYSLFGKSEPISPELLRINIGEVNRMPSNVRGKISEGRDFLWGNEAKPGEAYLTPNVENTAVTGKIEIEATITPDTLLTRSGQNYYTKIGNRRVPIDQFQAEFGVKGNKPSIEGNKPTTAREVAESMEYYNPNAKKGILKPSSIFSQISRTNPLSNMGDRIESELFSEKYREAPQSEIFSSRHSSSRIAPRSSLSGPVIDSSPIGSSRSDPFASSSIGAGSSRFNPFSDESSTAGTMASRPIKEPPEFKAKSKKGKVKRGRDRWNEEMRVVTKIQTFEEMI